MAGETTVRPYRNEDLPAIAAIWNQVVEDSLAACGVLGFRLLQFNAVVASNLGAIALYESQGFVRLGTIPGGFRSKDGGYEDIIVFYHRV